MFCRRVCFIQCFESAALCIYHFQPNAAPLLYRAKWTKWPFSIILCFTCNSVHVHWLNVRRCDFKHVIRCEYQERLYVEQINNEIVAPFLLICCAFMSSACLSTCFFMHELFFAGQRSWEIISGVQNGAFKSCNVVNKSAVSTMHCIIT